jgi:hypothetical protein
MCQEEKAHGLFHEHAGGDRSRAAQGGAAARKQPGEGHAMPLRRAQGAGYGARG